MKYFYDLHIHTVLSPCADVLMTPNNLWNMVSLKGLDFVAFVDHNSTRQLPMLSKIGESYRTKQIFGLEVSLESGIHVLCYFKHLVDAVVVGEQIESHLPQMTSYMGSSHLTDEYDSICESVQIPLSENTNLSIHELMNILAPYEHLLVLAHLNRYPIQGMELVSQVSFDAVEWTDSLIPPAYFIGDIPWMFNSDSHDLIQILEQGSNNCVDISTHSIDCFFERFHHG